MNKSVVRIITRSLFKTIFFDILAITSSTVGKALFSCKLFTQNNNEKLNNNTEDMACEMQRLETCRYDYNSNNELNTTPNNQNFCKCLVKSGVAGFVGYTTREISNEIVKNFNSTYNNIIVATGGLIGGGLKYLINYNDPHHIEHDSFEHLRSHMLAGSINSVIYQLLPEMPQYASIACMTSVEALDGLIHSKQEDWINKVSWGAFSGMIAGIAYHVAYVPIIEAIDSFYDSYNM